MRIINVVEMVDNSIISLRSYLIEEDQLSQEVIERAEEDFSNCAIENGCSEDEVDDFVENGNYLNDNYSVFLTWSDVLS